MKKITNLLTVLMFFAITSAAFAQGSTTSSLNGKVIDNEGNPLPGANVVAIHTPSGTKYGSATDFDGLYRISNMRVGGPYIITISYVGFDEFVQENVFLQLGQRARVNAQLKETSNTLEEVVISAQSNSVFNRNKTGVETIIDSKKIQTLPSTSRAIADFVRLTPQASITEGNDGFSISIAGQNNRLNAIYVDGAVNNDTFGLAGSGTNGGQTGVNPFSIDAIEQFQVSVAPFDVKIAGFTGGAINAITKSGRNNFFGTAYGYFRNQDLVGKTPVDLVPAGESREKIADFTAQTYGFTLGGPIAKDKAFFFINYERQDDETPRPFNFGNYTGDSSLSDIQNLASVLQSRYGYNPGTFTDHLNTLVSDRIVSRFDFNINESNKISLSYRMNKTENLEARGSNNFNVGFLNGSEFFKHTDHSGSLEWNYSGDKTSNSLIIGYTKVDDDRDPSGSPFPWVQIRDGSGRITFGGERFSTANLLESSTLTITNNFEIYSGVHNITIGTHNEFTDIKNLFFASNFGNYEYSNLDDFLNDANPRIYQRGYSLLSDGAGDSSSGAAEFKLAQFGLYFQDEVEFSDNFKLSAGLRFDLPKWDDGRVNNDFNTRAIPLLEAAGKDLRGARVGKGINSILHVSPRVGFNWNLKGKHRTQIRGGFGVFVSRIPLVWPGGIYNNNGVTGGYTFDFGPDDIVFNPDVNNQPVDVAPGTGAVGGNVDLFAPNTKLPQVFKTNLAIDRQLPGGITLSADILYNKNIQSIYYENLNVGAPVGNLTGTGDNRPIYNRRDEVDDTYGRIILGYNTSKGYSWNASTTISKNFDNGLSATVSYSYGDSRSIFDLTSSQNSSQWRNIQTVNGKNSALPVSRSDFATGSRINSFVSYEFKWLEIAKTTFSLFYEGQQGSPFSYIYRDGDDLLNDDSRGNALIYVPASQADINFVGTPEEQLAQWNALNAYISGNDYLNSRRGDYVERNGDRGPWNHVVDFKLIQEFKLGADSKHALAFTFDIFNLTNLLNKKWGVRKFIAGNVSLIEMEGFQADGTTPEFRFDPSIIDRLEQIDDFGLQSSRWQMNFGLKYIFN